MARRAIAAGARVVAVCGRCLLDDRRLAAAGIEAAYACADLEPDPARSMSDAATLLKRLGARIAEEHLGASLRDCGQPTDSRKNRTISAEASGPAGSV